MVREKYFCCKCSNAILVTEKTIKKEGIFFNPSELICNDCPIDCVDCGQELTVWEDQYCRRCEGKGKL